MVTVDQKEPDMKTATATVSRASRRIGRLKRILREFDYVQRRVLENQTGVPFITAEERRRSRQRVAQLEYLYRS
jgi:hypothetical protein